jgi:hypothetical protein
VRTFLNHIFFQKMQFVHFPESNRALGAPEGMTPEEVGTLHVYADGQQCISCWMPSQAEREAIAAGLPVYLGVMVSADPTKPVFTQSPVFITAVKPDMPAVVLPTPEEHELTPKWDDALRQFASRLPLPEHAGSRPVPGAVLLRKHPELLTPAGQPLEPTKLYYVGSPENQAEHLDNLRELFRQGGKVAIVPYLQPYAAFLGQPDAQPAH